MKSSIMHLLSLFLILGFAASCGKKSASGGSSNSSNPLYNNTNITQSGTVAYTSVKAWYDAADVHNMLSYGEFLKSSQNVSSGFSGSLNICFFGLGNCQTNQSNGCYSTNPGGKYRKGSPTITNGAMTSCTPVNVEYTKAENTELASAISGNGLVLLNATRSGTIYTLTYAAQNSFVPSIIYTIDTSLHSLLNPVMIQEPTKITSLKSLRMYN